MKPIKINSLEDLARAVAQRNATAKDERPDEYRHFTNAEGDILRKLPEHIQSKLKAARTAAVMVMATNERVHWSENVEAQRTPNNRRFLVLGADNSEYKHLVEGSFESTLPPDQVTAMGRKVYPKPKRGFLPIGADFGNMEAPRAHPYEVRDDLEDPSAIVATISAAL